MACVEYGFSAVQPLSRVQLFVTPWTAACQSSQFITNSRNLFKLMFIESVRPSNHLILCHPLLLLPSVFHIRHLLTWEVHLSVSCLFAFHTVHGVLKAGMLKWFAIPFSSGHILSDLSTRTCPSGLPRRHGLVSLRSAPAATDHKGWLKQQKFIFSQF